MIEQLKAENCKLLEIHNKDQFYKIPQKHIENTEHMCYNFDSVSKDREIM